jgi:D-serine deaminase-like pyridoxal phosphate-dependent protein
MTAGPLDLPLALDPAAALPVPLGDPRLDTPAMLVDLDVAEANIASMAAYAQRAGLKLRPHVKTHKSIAMARRQRAAGAAGLCVATVSEAEVFAGAGIADLTLAYPVVGARKLARLAQVCQGAPVTLVADSAAVLEVDTGMRRAGALPAAVPDLAGQVAKSAGLEFAGILTHAGQAHGAAGQLGIEQVARHEAAVMGDVRADLEQAGHEVRVVSAGSSLTSRYLTAADGITEIRPGTYIYNDLRTPEQIAVSMLAAVVSTGDGGARVTVDAGSKTLTTTTDPVYAHGHLAGRPDATVTRLSEEHGVLTVTGAPPAVGDLVRILPVHVCVWSDLQPEVYGTRRGEIVERIRVDAFRHSL